MVFYNPWKNSSKENEFAPPPQDAGLPPPPRQLETLPNRTREMAQKLSGTIQDFEPLLDALGIDKAARGKIVVSLITKGKLPGGLMSLFGAKDNRTRMEKFWDGMASGLPFILALYGLLVLTLFLHRWGIL